MSNINNQESGITPVEKHKQRRAFLKRSAAGVVITSLPAQSVWGSVCTVSGAMSGNQSGIQRHSNCVKPYLPLGRSPSTWKAYVVKSSNISNQVNTSNVHDVFECVPNKTGKVNGLKVCKSQEAYKIRLCYLSGVKEVAEKGDMSVDNDLITPAFQVNLYDALTKPGGVDYNIAAVWLNVYFGLYASHYEASDVNVANKVVEGLLSYISIETQNGSSPTLNDAFYNFGNGKTGYKFSACQL